MAYIETGKNEGATLEMGGKRHGDQGYYIQPTIFTNVVSFELSGLRKSFQARFSSTNLNYIERVYENHARRNIWAGCCY